MHIALYRALKSIKMSDEAASQVVKAMEEHMAKSIADAVKPLEAKIDALTRTQEAKIEELKTRLSWVGGGIGLVGFGIAVAVALGPTIAKFAG